MTAEELQEEGIVIKMTNPYTSICIRCGKQRIVVSITEEIVNGGVVVSKETTCPDLECQKLVLALLEKEDEKRHQSYTQRLEKMSAKKPVKNNGAALA